MDNQDIIFYGHRIESNDGTPVEPVEYLIDPNTFRPVVRITIPEEKFEDSVIICAANAVEIHTEPMPDGRYKVKRRLRGYKPTIVEDESVIEFKQFGSKKEFIKWMEELPTKDAVDVYRQIYFDRWNFDTGSSEDRFCYELLDEEFKGRE